MDPSLRDVKCGFNSNLKYAGELYRNKLVMKTTLVNRESLGQLCHGLFLPPELQVRLLCTDGGPQQQPNDRRLRLRVDRATLCHFCVGTGVHGFWFCSRAHRPDYHLPADWRVGERAGHWPSAPVNLGQSSPTHHNHQSWFRTNNSTLISNILPKNFCNSTYFQNLFIPSDHTVSPISSNLHIYLLIIGFLNE